MVKGKGRWWNGPKNLCAGRGSVGLWSGAPAGGIDRSGVGNGAAGAGRSGRRSADFKERLGGEMKVVVVQSPRALRGLLKLLFGIKD